MPPYPIDWFKPQDWPQAPILLQNYRSLDKNEKYGFLKQYPDYFKTSQEGGDYIDICERITVENTRNLWYLIDERDCETNTITDKQAVLNMIDSYKNKPIHYELVPHKYWPEMRLFKAQDT